MPTRLPSQPRSPPASTHQLCLVNGSRLTKCPRKRNADAAGRQIHERWESKYTFVLNGNKPVCLFLNKVCNICTHIYGLTFTTGPTVMLMWLWMKLSLTHLSYDVSDVSVWTFYLFQTEETVGSSAQEKIRLVNARGGTVVLHSNPKSRQEGPES